MKSEDEIKKVIKYYEDCLKLLEQNYEDNENEDLNWLYIRQIGLTEGVIKGLEIALGSKIKLKLKSK